MSSLLVAVRQVATIGSAEVVGRLVTFAFSAAVSRVAGLDVLGYMSLALALVAYVTIAGDSGLNQDSTRCLIAGDEPSVVVREAIRIQLSVAAIAFVIMGAVVYLVYGFPVSGYYAVLAFVPLFAALATPYLLDSKRRIGVLTLGRLAQTVTIGVVGLALVLLGTSGSLLCLAYGVGYGVSALFVARMGGADYRWALHRCDPQRFKRRMVVLRRLGLAGLLLHLFSSLPILVAGLLPASVLGEMGVISRVWFLASAPAGMAGAVLLPLMTSEGTRRRLLQVCAIGIALGSLASALLIATSSWLLPSLFGSDAAAAVPEFRVFMLALPLFGVIAPTSAFLIARHSDRSISFGYSAGVVGFLAVVAISAVSSVSIGALTVAIGWVVGCSCVACMLAIACGLSYRTSV